MLTIHLIIGVGLLLWYSRRKKAGGLEHAERFLLVAAVTGNIVGTLLTCNSKSGISFGTAPALVRGGYQEQTREEELEVSMKNGENQKITVLVPARRYDEEETRRWLDEAEQKLETIIKGSNGSLQHVEQDLHLVTQIPDSPVTVSWDTNEPLLVGYEGKLSEDIPKEGADVQLRAVLTLQGETRRWSRQITVYPDNREKTPEEKLQIAIQEMNTDDTAELYLLPTELDGEALEWKRAPDRTGNYIAVLTLLVVVLYRGMLEEKKAEARKKRNEALERDYPEIVSSLLLLLGAGLSMRKAFEKLACDYRLRRKVAGKRLAYEEILYTWQEMEGGIAEYAAYEHLGNRCQGTSYRSLATLLTQNLKRGSKGLPELLEQEANEAFEERRRRAREEGEKAGTKLLLPMILMLGVVFLLILIPAFMSFYA